MINKWLFQCFSMWLFVAPIVFAKEPGKGVVEEKAKESLDKPLRVGGDYQIADIERLRDDEFKIVFEAVSKTGKFDSLILISDHVNLKVEKGQVLRISAEIAKEEGASAEVTQVLLFLPNGNSHVPMWMLSKRFPGRELRGSRYIDMHTPTSDFIVL